MVTITSTTQGACAVSTNDNAKVTVDTNSNGEAGTTLGYNRRESASDSCCMHAFPGQDARLPEWDVLGVDTTGHHILGITDSALSQFRALG
jgi:hypothetical protein